MMGYASLGLLAVGGGALGFGIPAIAIGNHKVPRETQATITPIVSPLGGGLRITF